MIIFARPKFTGEFPKKNCTIDLLLERCVAGRSEQNGKFFVLSSGTHTLTTERDAEIRFASEHLASTFL